MMKPRLVKRYHKDIFFPDFIYKFKDKLKSKVNLVYTNHSFLEAAKDRYLVTSNLPEYLDLNSTNVTLIEAKIFFSDNEPIGVSTFLFRTSYTENTDILLACFPIENNNSILKVKTVWSNNSNDFHFTLNRKIYTCV